METNLSTDHALRAAGDALFPGTATVPSAGAVDLGAQVERVLQVAPGFRAGLTAALLRLARAADAVSELRRLYADDPAAFGSFSNVVTHAYLLDPGVRDAIGYPGQTPIATPASSVPAYLENGTLERVVELSPGPRATPEP